MLQAHPARTLAFAVAVAVLAFTFTGTPISTLSQPGVCAVCTPGAYCPGAKHTTPCPANSVSPPGATSAAQC
eukprot:2543171-Rhodomonas_salina.1